MRGTRYVGRGAGIAHSPFFFHEGCTQGCASNKFLDTSIVSKVSIYRIIEISIYRIIEWCFTRHPSSPGIPGCFSCRQVNEGCDIPCIISESSILGTDYQVLRLLYFFFCYLGIAYQYIYLTWIPISIPQHYVRLYHSVYIKLCFLCRYETEASIYVPNIEMAASILCFFVYRHRIYIYIYISNSTIFVRVCVYFFKVLPKVADGLRPSGAAHPHHPVRLPPDVGDDQAHDRRAHGRAARSRAGAVAAPAPEANVGRRSRRRRRRYWGRSWRGRWGWGW